MQAAFVINACDNVCTALEDLSLGAVQLRGDIKSLEQTIDVLEEVKMGHKIALKDIKKDDLILKYNVVIGKATADIKKGSWVHLHCMCSLYDERSSHLDVHTGAPKDIVYE